MQVSSSTVERIGFSVQVQQLRHIGSNSVCFCQTDNGQNTESKLCTIVLQKEIVMSYSARTKKGKFLDTAGEIMQDSQISPSSFCSSAVHGKFSCQVAQNNNLDVVGYIPWVISRSLGKDWRSL